MFEFSEELKKYFTKRDRAIKGLRRCVTYLSPPELEERGCVSVQSEYYEEDGDEYEFHVHEKEGKRIVSLQVYEAREGGMYHQVMYTTDGELPA
ncbi:MAG: hypothetical protein U5Q03_11075 [Bacteroidota bacterium]|nr:hypothetical protein [Bacteroidota bacterium]